MGYGGTVQFPVYMTERKRRRLFTKASKECKTASPTHDVLDLLLVYYINNKFILHRSIKERNSTIPKVEKKSDTKVWVRLPREENDALTKKVKKDGISKTDLMNLLIDHYLRNEFKIKTRIIRVNRQQNQTLKKST